MTHAATHACCGAARTHGSAHSTDIVEARPFNKNLPKTHTNIISADLPDYELQTVLDVSHYYTARPKKSTRRCVPPARCIHAPVTTAVLFNAFTI